MAYLRAVPMLLVVLALGACSSEPAEQRVRAAIEAAAAAAEATDAGEFGDYLAADFVGDNGRVDAADLVGLLRVQRLRGEHVSVLLGPVAIERRGARMQASFHVTLGGGGRLLPERMGVYEVESSWRLADDEWRCYAATWQRGL